mgnify:CR=1 FL=1
MTNPLVHALVLIAAILIPGGLIVYLAWAASKSRAVNTDKSQLPTPEEARNAFLAMYPPDSRRARNRLFKLPRYRYTMRNRTDDSE